MGLNSSVLENHIKSNHIAEFETKVRDFPSSVLVGEGFPEGGSVWKRQVLNRLSQNWFLGKNILVGSLGCTRVNWRMAKDLTFVLFCAPFHSVQMSNIHLWPFRHPTYVLDREPCPVLYPQHHQVIKPRSNIFRICYLDTGGTLRQDTWFPWSKPGEKITR